MYTIFGAAILMLSYVMRWVKLLLLKSPKILLEKTIYVFRFKYLEEYFTDYRSLSQSKSIFAIEQKAIFSCYV